MINPHTINKVLSPLNLKLSKKKIEGWKIDDINNAYNSYEEKTKPSTCRYINIGSGDFYHPLWHNVDLPSSTYEERQKISGIDIPYDLMSGKPLPIADEVLKVAYTSHTIEHIRDEDTQHLFKEIYRCLQPNGVFRITCPDIDLFYQAYKRKDLRFFLHNSGQTLEQKFIDSFASQLSSTHPNTTGKKFSDEEIRAVFDKEDKETALEYFKKYLNMDIQYQYLGNHINWYDYKKIHRMLAEAGFQKIWPSRFGQSTFPGMRNTMLFDSSHPEFSIYVECAK